MCTSTGTAIGTQKLENDRVRVTEWRFPKRGDNTGWHRHEYDYVVIPMFDGVLEIDLPGGERMIAELKTGVPYSREIGTEHDVINGNDFECSFIEVELLEPRASEKEAS
ncbi:cupin [Phaeobacter gallaeciensis]|uniref:Cupin n=2 Tax=Roseobacteraceae TaxID=2854170 RepID=A0A366X406_9RHOB|nr:MULTISPECIES: cupin domain-containing protein [Roseobacteraceae]MBT3141875.1 cupin domain-containing protein [Falsiruegeria litorea]MBT8168778.1 cupin domain-containing protein [Falsiruegeria litorea]RBW59972.1 cupin [Phaeobacter gallaeciensis]